MAGLVVSRERRAHIRLKLEGPITKKKRLGARNSLWGELDRKLSPSRDGCPCQTEQAPGGWRTGSGTDPHGYYKVLRPLKGLTVSCGGHWSL